MEGEVETRTSPVTQVLVVELEALFFIRDVNLYVDINHVITLPVTFVLSTQLKLMSVLTEFDVNDGGWCQRAGGWCE